MSVKFKRRVGLTAALILLASLLTWSLSALAQEPDRGEKLKQLEAAAEQLYTHMQQGSVSEAAADMGVLTATLEGLSFQGLTSVEGIHALAEAIMDTKATLAKAEVVPEEWAESSARLRLAVNSLLHTEHALWQQYYTVMAHDLQQMSKARAGGKPAALRTALQALQRHYEIIRPAAIIRRSPSDINQFTSWLSYVGRLSQERTWDEAALREALVQGEGALKGLFGRRGDEPVFLPITGPDSPWYWSGMIGLWIVLALGYAGIRKFMGNQSITPVRRTKEEGFRYRL
ncbi:sporulation protein YpjB [Paenibacillus senegalimassiliensis]|uniref:sporulation protein YpjB n=1 Tax=Paenibacillus senegalimassiliensis TaxID=1737426 RepID=UPI001E348197|nr:sporulation protein YpjB [Paenibacillus senegalimassiliensis]